MNLPGVGSVMANNSMENVRPVYQQILARICDSSRFTNFVKISERKSFFSDLDRFLRVKLRDFPALTSESCKARLKSEMENLFQVRIYNLSSRRLVVVDLEENLQLSRLSINRLPPTSSKTLCETDLSEISDFKVFKINFRTESKPSLASDIGDNNRSDLISIVAIFAKNSQLDIGQLSLACVKFFSENVTNN